MGPPLLEKVEQVVSLIRSKGVGEVLVSALQKKACPAWPTNP